MAPPEVPFNAGNEPFQFLHTEIEKPASSEPVAPGAKVQTEEPPADAQVTQPTVTDELFSRGGDGEGDTKKVFQGRAPPRPSHRLKAALETEHDGNSSDGNKKEEDNEYLTASGYDSDLSVSSIGIIPEPLQRRRRVMQFQRYVMQLESRVSRLESEGPKPPAGINVKGWKPAIPELNLMSWEEYLKTKGKPVSLLDRNAIDVLVDEPVISHQHKLRTEVRESEQATNASNARKSEGLPSRIRINSDLILEVLSKLSKRSFVFPRSGHPKVFLRPYKMLFFFENEIKDELSDMISRLQSKEKSLSEEGKELPAETVGTNESQTRLTQEQSDDAKHASAGAGTEEPLGQRNSASVENSPEGVSAITSEPDPKVSDKDSLKSEKDEDSVEAFDEKPKVLQARLNSQEGIDDLRCLVRFIDDYLRPAQDRFDHCIPEKVRFRDLWHLVRPGKVVYIKEVDSPQNLWKVIQVTGGRPLLSPGSDTGADEADRVGIGYPIPENNMRYLSIGRDQGTYFGVDCLYYDYNGTGFGPVLRHFEVHPYDGEREIKDLKIMPYSYATHYGLIDDTAVKKRAEKLFECTEVCHRYYSGPTLNLQPGGFWLKRDYEMRGSQRVPIEKVDSEIIIDFRRAYVHNPAWQPVYENTELYGFEMMHADETQEGQNIGEPDNHEDIDWDYLWDRKLRNALMEMINFETIQNKIPEKENLLLLPSRVFAFVMKSKRWASLDINNVTAVESEKNGFDDLELPEGHRSMVEALVNTHFRTVGSKDLREEENQFDLVKDKGKGLIILLHGAPGVGKTSTAECMAASMGKPLLTIACGDLGTTAKEVETTLQLHFDYAQAWGCVLLLDEADVFLAERGMTDLDRNAVVSVFLRVLEYYQGILFLTTNRVGTFDEAFRSRIHVALFYPLLNADKTARIWAMHIRRLKKRLESIEIDEKEIKEYAALHYRHLSDQSAQDKAGGSGWNGRQIRNAFQSATALAQFEAAIGSPVKLQVRHFETVAGAAAEFDNYLFRTYGQKTEHERAFFNFFRADSEKAGRNPISSYEKLKEMYSGGGHQANFAYPTMQTMLSQPSYSMGLPNFGMAPQVPNYSNAGFNGQVPQPSPFSSMGAHIGQFPPQHMQHQHSTWPMQGLVAPQGQAMQQSALQNTQLPLQTTSMHSTVPQQQTAGQHQDIGQQQNQSQPLQQIFPNPGFQYPQQSFQSQQAVP